MFFLLYIPGEKCITGSSMKESHTELPKALRSLLALRFAEEASTLPLQRRGKAQLTAELSLKVLSAPNSFFHFTL
jgi:hypothetical protein